jgi:hypothetical protein
MIRDILNAVKASMDGIHPPGVTGPTSDEDNVGAGVVSFHADNRVFGVFKGQLEIVTSGEPGTATAKLSLDAEPLYERGGNFDSVFTLPADKYSVPLPAISPGLGSPGPSGLALSFSGSFTAGDIYSFVALPEVTVLFGEEEVASQDSLFPRVVIFPTEDEFKGPEDFSQGLDQRTRQRALLTDVAGFEGHCWGIDYDRTELLRDLVLNAIHFAVSATKTILPGHWESGKRIGKTGQLYVLRWTITKPVLVLEETTRPLAPPFTTTITPEINS